MDSITSATTVVAQRPTSAARPGDTASTVPTPEPGDGGHDAARLATVVELIKNLTGREVKLVPPTAYIVGPVETPEPVAPVDLAVPSGLLAQYQQSPGALVVDITSILRGGASSQLTLGQNSGGSLALFNHVDVTI